MIEIKSANGRQSSSLHPFTMEDSRRVPLLVSNQKAYVWEVDGMQVAWRRGWPH